MSNDLQTAKFEREFRNIDTDNDGMIEETDVDVVVQSWCIDFGFAPGTAQWRRINSWGHLMWRNLIGVADEDGYKKVSMADWVASHQQPGFIEKVAMPFAQMAVDLADTDNDGRLSEQDWLTGQRSTGQSEEEIIESFRYIDTDNDGYVTKDECYQAIKEFYLSNDPDVAGNMIAGRI
jgi:Ca2+-binding EF-hand superfamily protein